MTPRARLAVAAGVVGVSIVAGAFVATPRACEGGLEAYFGSGVVALLLLSALPFALLRTASVPARAGLALLLVAGGVAAWVAGLFAADVRILCRLF